MNKQQDYYARGNFTIRAAKIPLLFLSWFAPYKGLRVFFHKLRGVRIGKNVEIGYFCIIGNVHPHMISIDDNVIVTARVTILEHDNSYYYSGRGDVRFGKVKIGKNAFIGIGTVIMPGITIGENSIVGALSFVNKDIPPTTIAGGNPVRIIKDKF